MERVGGERRALVAPRGAKRHERTAEVDHDHDPHGDEDPPGRIHLGMGPDQAAYGQPGHEEPEDREERRLGQSREVLGFAVSVGVGAIGGPAGHPDCKEREQRRDEVCAGVDRLGQEAEAVRPEADAELDRDEDARGDDRHERGAPLRGHGLNPACPNASSGLCPCSGRPPDRECAAQLRPSSRSWGAAVATEAASRSRGRDVAAWPRRAREHPARAERAAGSARGGPASSARTLDAVLKSAGPREDPRASSACCTRSAGSARA